MTNKMKPFPSLTTGGKMILHPTIFSPNGQLSFVIQSNQVKVVGVVSGEEVGSPLVHENDIVSCFLNPFNSLQLFVVTDDWRLFVWDYSDFVLLSTSLLIPKEKPKPKENILCSVVLDPKNEGVFYLLSKTPSSESSQKSWNKKIDEKEEEEEKSAGNQKPNKRPRKQQDRHSSSSSSSRPPSYRLTRCDTNTKKNNQSFLSFFSFDSPIISVDTRGNHLVCCAGKTIHFLHLHRNFFVEILKSRVAISCFSFHPTEDYFVTGFKSGEICFWRYSVQLREKRANEVSEQNPSSSSSSFSSLRTSMVKNIPKQWHSHPVRALSFTPDGCYLLSGGQEGVVVIWQLSTNQPQFIPRLGGPISHLSVSPKSDMYCVSLGTNVLLFLSGVSQKLESQVIGLRPLQAIHRQTQKVKPTLIAPCNVPNQIVVSAKQGMIQFYDVFTERTKLEIGVLPKEQSVFGEVGLNPPKVDLFALSTDMKSLVTVERQSFFGQNIPPIVYLKFWYLTPKGHAKLHTRFDNPHNSVITSISYDPNSHTVVTSSMDRKFKIWENVSLNPARQNKGPIPKETRWQCRGEGKFLRYEARSVAFSPDSSLLAVAFHQIVTLWSPSTCTLLHILSSPPPLQKVSFMFFAPSPHPYLVVCTDTHLFVWNLLTLTVWWSLGLETSSIAVDFNQPRFAVVCSKGLFETQEASSYVLMFSFESPRPLGIWMSTLVSDICFVKTDPSEKNESCGGSSSYLVGITPASKTILFGEEGKVFSAKRKASITMAGGPSSDQRSEEEQSNYFRFSDIYGGFTKSEKEERVDVGEFEKEKSEERASHFHEAVSLFDMPSHILPSVSEIHGSFMDRLLKKGGRNPSTTTEEEEDLMDDVDTQEKGESQDEETDISRISNDFMRLMVVPDDRATKIANDEQKELAQGNFKISEEMEEFYRKLV